MPALPGILNGAEETGLLFPGAVSEGHLGMGPCPGGYFLPRLGMSGWKQPCLRREATSLSGISPPLGGGTTALFHKMVDSGE